MPTTIRSPTSARQGRAPTFAEAAAVAVEHKRSGWRNPKHAQDWPASLERFVFPQFRQRSVSEVTSADVLGVLPRSGKRHDGPTHHRAAAARDAYVEVTALEEPNAALFQTVDPAGGG